MKLDGLKLNQIVRWTILINLTPIASISANMLAPAASPVCSPIWNSTQAYLGGNTVSYNHVNYTANWWTQGQNPASNQGPVGSGQPWTSQGSCDSQNNPTPAPSPIPSSGNCFSPWNETAVYLAGQKVSDHGSNYQANWWTQGQLPSTNHGLLGSGQPWTELGACTASASPSPTPATPAPSHSPSPSPVPLPPVTATPIPSLPPSTPNPTNKPTAGFVFSPYKDITINMDWNSNVISTSVTGIRQTLLSTLPNHLDTVTWAFATGECGQETWGGISPKQLASANISSWASAGKKYILATGGAAGKFTCGSDAGFDAFIQTYSSPGLIGIDFDIEGGQTDAEIADLVRRVQVAQVKYPQLRFSFTLATLGGNAKQSLNSLGTAVMQAIHSANLPHAIINLMTMDYGSPSSSVCTVGSNGQCDMGQSAIQASEDLHSYWNVPYSQIELTPMIGGNDVQSEVFTLSNATAISAYALQNKLAGIHFWSFDRDRDCAPGYASPTCNSYGVAGVLGFTQQFLNNLGQ